jgi:hypothetical protein
MVCGDYGSPEPVVRYTHLRRVAPMRRFFYVRHAVGFAMSSFRCPAEFVEIPEYSYGLLTPVRYDVA